MVTVVETDEWSDKKPKEKASSGSLNANNPDRATEPEKSNAKQSPLKKSISLGLNKMGGVVGINSEAKSSLQLKLGLAPNLKLTGLSSNRTALLSKAQRGEESQKMYEEGLTSILKSYHKEYLK